MSKRDFLTVRDFSLKEIFDTFILAEKLKKNAQKRKFKKYLANQVLAMIFNKTSTRTRVSFEVAMAQLGGKALYLNQNDIQINKGETLYDTAKVLSRMVQGIMIRTFAHEDVVNLARASSVPVINGLTDLLHPCQAMADFFTIFEHKPHFGRHPNLLKLAYIGDGNNVANSLILLSALLGNTFVIANPKGYEIPSQIVEMAKDLSKKSGAQILFEENPLVAAKKADVLYTDVWVSMGQEEEKEARLKAFQGYQINGDMIQEAKTDVMVLHCLPAQRGLEITDEVMDGPHSKVFDEAENRLHVQKAILLKLMQK